jgi:protein-export membrane protein SecD
MDKKFTTRLFVIGAVLIIALIGLWPTMRLSALGPDGRTALQASDPDAYASLRANAISLGLDLQGGMHMVLEVDSSGMTEEESVDAYKRALEVIRNRIDEFGVEEPILQPMGDGRILVQLAGVDDPERAKNIIRRTAFLEFKLVARSTRTVELLNVIDEIVAEKQVPEEEAGTAVEGTDSTAVELASAAAADSAPMTDSAADSSMDALFGGLEIKEPADPEQGPSEHPFLDLLQTFHDRNGGMNFAVPEENIEKVDAILAMPEVADIMPDDLEFRLGAIKKSKSEVNSFDNYVPLYLLQREAEITGAAVARASLANNDRNFNEPVVSLTFKSEYVKRFAQITGENTGRQLAIVLDGKVRSAPNLRVRIPDGRSQIEGAFTVDEARDLAVVLRSGALPAPIRIVEERTVGSTLGHDSISAGTNAGIIGLVCVVIFMMIYYRASGLIANTVLFANVILILSALALFNANLTLPGIAGIVLTMGMAVDANVLVFERIREEFRTGKSVYASIQAGYERAFTTILDANITTFLTGLILFYYGSGPIRGFAITLMIGIITSVFTAVYCSRLAFDFLYSTGRMRRLSI